MVSVVFTGRFQAANAPQALGLQGGVFPAVPSAPSLALAFPSPRLWGPLHAAAESPRAEKVILGGETEARGCLEPEESLASCLPPSWLHYSTQY